MFKYLSSFLILFIFISCSEGVDKEDKSSFLIKPNFNSLQSRYDCILSDNKSLNNLEAFIPSFVDNASNLIPSATLEFLFDQDNDGNDIMDKPIYFDVNMFLVKDITKLFQQIQEQS